MLLQRGTPGPGVLTTNHSGQGKGMEGKGIVDHFIPLPQIPLPRVWHPPECITIAKFEDDLLRQNSLIHDQWRVYRRTDVRKELE